MNELNTIIIMTSVFGWFQFDAYDKILYLMDSRAPSQKCLKRIHADEWTKHHYYYDSRLWLIPFVTWVAATWLIKGQWFILHSSTCLLDETIAPRI